MKTILKFLIPVIATILILTAVLVAQDTKEQVSPSDTIQENQIIVTENGIQVKLPGAIIVQYRDTNSMDPILDMGVNGIEIPVTKDTELNIGDIVSYNSSWNETLISHRIIDINQDEQGKYYTLKGDNNSSEDPEKVRINQIKYKLVMVIY